MASRQGSRDRREVRVAQGSMPLTRWLHVVTSDAVVGRERFAQDAVDVIEALGEQGAFHLRTRTLGGRSYVALARRLLDTSRKHRCSLIINERVDVAIAAGADGVQLGRDALAVVDVDRIAPVLEIGRSVHSADEARAESGICDWIFFGNVFETESHPGAASRLDALRGVTEATRIPVIAIGGIT